MYVCRYVCMYIYISVSIYLDIYIYMYIVVLPLLPLTSLRAGAGCIAAGAGMS